jgi:RNase P/RNase MRP subunit p29
MNLLGKTLEVIASTNPDATGLRGTVIEDGRDTIRIRASDGSEKLLVKHTITVTVDGLTLGSAELRGTHVHRLKR